MLIPYTLSICMYFKRNRMKERKKESVCIYLHCISIFDDRMAYTNRRTQQKYYSTRSISMKLACIRIEYCIYTKVYIEHAIQPFHTSLFLSMLLINKCKYLRWFVDKISRPPRTFACMPGYFHLSHIKWMKCMLERFHTYACRLSTQYTHRT